MKLAKIIFVIFGIVAPILIGALHTYAHFTDLLTEEIKSTLAASIPVFGESTPMFNTWGLMSFMMGGSFIVIGLLNLVSFSRLGKGESPPVGLFLAMMVYLGCVIYAGYTFSAAEQFYGGVVGMIAMIIALTLSLKNRQSGVSSIG